MVFDVAMKIFELSKKFPVEERYSLTNQIRRLSRSVGSPGVVVISLYYELLKEFYGKLFRLQTQ
jgi:hypothetical protein